jgi:hypothetical protein
MGGALARPPSPSQCRLHIRREKTVNQNGSIPYEQPAITLGGRTFALISWHYATGRDWNPSRDDLASHIAPLPRLLPEAGRAMNIRIAERHWETVRRLTSLSFVKG